MTKEIHNPKRLKLFLVTLYENIDYVFFSRLRSNTVKSVRKLFLPLELKCYSMQEFSDVDLGALGETFL